MIEWLRRRLWGLCLLCALLPAAAAHAEIAVDFAAVSPELDLASRLTLLEDTTGQLTAAQVLQSPAWQLAMLRDLNRGVTESAVWLQLKAVNRSDKPLTRWLVLGSPRLEHVHYYRFASDQAQLIESHVSGLAYPLGQRPQQGLVSIFPVRLQAGETATLLLRVSGRTRLFLQPALWEPLAYRAHESSLVMSQLLPLCALLGVALYMFVHGLAYKTIDMILLAAWLSCLAMYEFSYAGHLYRLVFNEGGEWALRATLLLSHFIMVFSSGFTVFYLRLQRYRQWYWVHCLFIAMGILLASMTAFGDLRAANWLTVPTLAIFFSFWPLSIAWAWRRRIKNAGLFLFASLTLWVSIMARLAEQQGWLPMDFLPDGGLTIHPSLLMSLIMVFASVRETFFAQRAFRTAQARLLKSRQDEYLRLETLVRERTQTLQDAVIAADEANRARSELLARVNLDLRRPADEIVNLSAPFEREGGDQAKYGAAIRRSAKDLQSLIDDLIEEAGSDNLPGLIKPCPVELLRLLDGLALEAEGLALANGNTFSWQAGSRVPAVVLLDPKRLRQVLINLLDNAAKFTRGGWISFQADVAAAAGGPDCLLFTISDSGVGMKQEQLSQLFEPYQRADNARGLPGVGLGLSIARYWVERMGGSITVDSAPGQGTTMKISLPLSVPDASEDMTATESVPAIVRPGTRLLEQARYCLSLGAISELLDWSEELESNYPQWLEYARSVRLAAQQQDLDQLRSLLLD